MYEFIRMNRIALLITASMVCVIAYDALRAPPFMQRLEAYDLLPAAETLERLNPRVPEEENAEPLLTKAFLKRLGRGAEETDRRILYNSSFIERVGVHPLLEIFLPIDKIYSEEEKQSLKRKVEQDSEVLAIIHKSVERPYLQYSPPPNNDCSKINCYFAYDAIFFDIAEVLAWEGLSALLDESHGILDQNVNTLQELIELFCNRSLVGECFLTRYDNIVFARIASHILVLLVENTLNRTEISEALLLRWQAQFSEPEYTSSDNLIKALMNANINRFYVYDWSTRGNVFNNRKPLTLLLKWSGVSAYYYKILAPDMSRYILKLSQTKEHDLLILLEELLSLESDRKYTTYESENFLTDSMAGMEFLLLKLYTDFIRTGIALYLYGQDHSTFPDTLEALVPEYLDFVPINPFTRDEPLQYRHEDDRVVLINPYNLSFTLLKSILPKEQAVTTQEQSS